MPDDDDTGSDDNGTEPQADDEPQPDDNAQPDDPQQADDEAQPDDSQQADEEGQTDDPQQADGEAQTDDQQGDDQQGDDQQPDEQAQTDDQQGDDQQPEEQAQANDQQADDEAQADDQRQGDERLPPGDAPMASDSTGNEAQSRWDDQPLADAIAGDGESANAAASASGDPEIYGSRQDYPNTENEDFEDDAGDWSSADYTDTAGKLFGDHEFFGDSAHQRRLDEGWQRVDNHDAWVDAVAQVHPDAAQSVSFYHRDGQVSALGFITTAALALLREAYPDLSLDNLHVTVPDDPERPRRAPMELPPSLQAIDPADKVDLRKYCSEVGDQGQTSRCAAFAWTHALEMTGPMLGRPVPRLSCSFTMMQFQRKQGDFKDYEYAWAGGDGTGSSAEPGPTLATGGTCNHDLWPNDRKAPVADDAAMERDALGYRLPAQVSMVDLEDLKKVLTAGHPVVLGMNTGKAFSELGRDGVVDAAEQPSGRHGRHAMLVVGYVGNYFIVKNSWGADWGDNGYCYIPKMVFAAADSEFEAVLVEGAAVVAAPPQSLPPPLQSQVPPVSSQVPQFSSSIPQYSSSVPPVSSSIPQFSSSVPQFSSSVPPPSVPPRPSQIPPVSSSIPPVSPLVPPLPSVAPARSVVPAASATVGGLLGCSACGRSVRPGRFCESCGHPLAPPPAPSQHFCAFCGATLTPTDRFCFACGAHAQ